MLDLIGNPEDEFSGDEAHISELIIATTLLPLLIFDHLCMSHVKSKPVFGVSDQVPHKSGCTGIEDG